VRPGRNRYAVNEKTENIGAAALQQWKSWKGFLQCEASWNYRMIDAECVDMRLSSLSRRGFGKILL
jgi:hypothetical protein